MTERTAIRNVTSTFARQVAVVALGFGLAVFLARVLGPEQNGQYAIAVLLPNLLTTLLVLGVPSANVFLIARRELTLSEAFKVTSSIWLFFSFVGIAAGAGIIVAFGRDWFPGTQNAHILIALFAFPVLLADAYLSGLLHATQDFKRFNAGLLFGPAFVLTAVVILVGVFDGGVLGAVIAFGVGRLLAAVYVFGLVKRKIGSLSLRTPAAFDATAVAKRTLGYGWKAHMSNVFAFLNYRLDILLVNGLLNPAAAGVYVVAVQIAERLWMIPQAVSTVFLPKLVSMHDDERGRRRITPLLVRWMFIVTLGASLMLSMIAEWAVPWIFGDAYDQASVVLLWLLPGVVMWSVTNVLSTDIAARGFPGLNSVTAGTSLAANVVCNLLWIPVYGVVGAAMATAVSYSLSLPVAMAIYMRVSGSTLREVLLPNREDLLLISAIRVRLLGSRTG